MKRSLTLLLFLMSLLLPGTLMAQTNEPQPADDMLRSGFSFIVTAGPSFNIEQRIYAGSEFLSTESIGGSLNLDIGYKTKYVGFYAELFLTAGFLTQDLTDSIDVLSFESSDNRDHNYNYHVLDKGDWDKSIGGFGALILGFIPVSENFVIDMGVGVQLVLSGELYDSNGGDLRIKTRIGFDVAVTRNLMLGLAINYMPSVFSGHHFDPQFSLIYTY